MTAKTYREKLEDRGRKLLINIIDEKDRLIDNIESQLSEAKKQLSEAVGQLEDAVMMLEGLHVSESALTPMRNVISQHTNKYNQSESEEFKIGDKVLVDGLPYIIHSVVGEKYTIEPDTESIVFKAYKRTVTRDQIIEHTKSKDNKEE